MDTSKSPKSMKRILVLGIGLLLVSPVPAGTDENGSAKRLEAVSFPELPAQTAAFVKAAPKTQQQTTTVAAVRTAVTRNPAAAATIVGTVASSVPDVAPIAAGTAAAAQPGQAAIIAQAAAAAAPAQASRIAAAVCRAVPDGYRNIAVAVAKAVPGSEKEVLQAVASVMPSLKPGIEKALATSGKISVAGVLDSAANTKAMARADSAVSAPDAATGPVMGPPYVPLSGTPINTDPANSTPVPPGGRDYTKP
jgi:hypothetical protein